MVSTIKHSYCEKREDLIAFEAFQDREQAIYDGSAQDHAAWRTLGAMPNEACQHVSEITSGHGMQTFLSTGMSI